MKKKPTITLGNPTKVFIRDGKKIISDEEARALWNSGAADWSQAAYQEMARRVMA